MMNNSPALWDHLLKYVPKGSALMGGAVIDYLLGTPVNDYDIFYSYKPGQGFILPGNWVPTMADFNDPVWIEQHEAQYKQGIDEFGNHPISVVYEYMVDGIHKVQLIGVNYDSPIAHLKNFDHSLTLASYDSKGMFVHQKVFESYDNKIIKYVSKNHEAKAVNKSLVRAKKKAAKLGMHFDWQFEGFDADPVPVKIAINGIGGFDF